MISNINIGAPGNGEGRRISPKIGRPGEMGQPFKLGNVSKEQANLIEMGKQIYGFNQYVSDMISVRRTLPDFRDEWYAI